MVKRKRKNKMLLVLEGILICMLLGWASCKGEIVSTSAPPPKKEQTASPLEEEIKEKETKVVWSYDPTNKRDPFKIPEPIQTGIKDTDRYYLDQMWIDGILLGGDSKNIAHIILPNGKDYFVKVGDILGANKGVVKEIRADGIVVEEQFLDPVDPTKIRIVDKFLKMETESASPTFKK